MVFNNATVGMVDLSGSMTQQRAKTQPLDATHTHLSNMGQMLESMELKIRNSIGTANPSVLPAHPALLCLALRAALTTLCVQRESTSRRPARSSAACAAVLVCTLASGTPSPRV